MTDILKDITPFTTFKGQPIPRLSFGHKALVLSLLDLQAPGMIDFAAAIYGCTRTKQQLLKSRQRVEAWEAEVVEWIDKVEFNQSDVPAATKILEMLLEETRENEVSPIHNDYADDPATGND